MNARFLCIIPLCGGGPSLRGGVVSFKKAFIMFHIKQKINIFFLGVVWAFFLLFPFHGVFASEITPDKVISLVNDARLANKAGILVKDEALTRAAQMKADDMFSKGYFAHTSPQGKTPWVWFEKAGYEYAYAGENLAIHFAQAEDQQRAWMESPTHRKNILNPEYREIGVAVRSGTLEGKKTIVTVQEFGRREGEAVPAGVSSVSTEKESEASPISEKPTAPAPIVSSTREGEISNASRMYEKVLLLLWGVMIAQVGILGMIVFRIPKRSRHITLAGETKEDEREYAIPVKILSSKTVKG